MEERATPADGGSTSSDPLQEFLQLADVVRVVVGMLDVRAMCRLACVSSHWNRLICRDGSTDEMAWRERAKEIGLAEEAAGATWLSAVRDGWSLRIGDCFEVVDTYDIASVARVMAKVESTIGPLLLFHFEGWSEVWFMWVHRVHDRDRIRPLTPRLPGIGPSLRYSEQSFNEKLAYAQANIRAEVSVWAPTRGRPQGTWPWPYTQGRACNDPVAFQLTLAQPGWAEAQAVRPFRTSAQLAESPADCLRAWCAATMQPASLAPPSAPAEAAEGLLHDGASSGSSSGSEQDEDELDDDDDVGFAMQPLAADGHAAQQAPALSWAVGERIEARDHVGMWYTARVSDVRVGVHEGRLLEEVLVHFEGWTGRWDEWQRSDASTLRRYSGMQRFGPAGSELGGGRWGGVAELAPPAGDNARADAHDAVAPPDRRTLLGVLLSALSRWQPAALTDAELCAQLVRLDEHLERLRAASPAVRAASALLTWAARLAFCRLARPVLLALLGLAEGLLLRILAWYARRASESRSGQPSV